MATTDVMQRDESLLMASLLDFRKGDASVSRGLSLEKKIELLESMAGQVSNRRSRRWLNDRILMELVPRLNGEEIRGLFAPPPWGDDVPPSAFSLTNVGEWDKFRNIDMDKEAKIMDSLNRSHIRRKGEVDTDRTAVLNAWRRIDCRTREALRRSFLPELIEGYENYIRHFLEEGGEGDVLELRVQDPFHRLLLHGVCEFYNLASVTETEQIVGAKSRKTTKIRRKKGGSAENPNISLAHFLKMTKEGAW
ncbi:PREDICTED: R3H domain-containing protein 4 [Tarenaya hassleriana]|uniref:R3H domain-containing protein 4 n=1 Tax=Tarenaya hassleriana TaxID=28532 RepID=UPI00053C9962|nr:PREDICTED: R3H domain-containing protein 4 [Tarenaya hassleriana]